MQREPSHNIPKSILPNVLKHLTWTNYVPNKSVWWNIPHVATFLVLAIDKSISLPETTNLWRYISKTIEDGISRKTAISYPLIRTRTCAYQEVRNVSFSKYFAFMLNGWSLKDHTYHEQKEMLRVFLLRWKYWQKLFCIYNLCGMFLYLMFICYLADPLKWKCFWKFSHS